MGTPFFALSVLKSSIENRIELKVVLLASRSTRRKAHVIQNGSIQTNIYNTTRCLLVMHSCEASSVLQLVNVELILSTFNTVG